MIRPAVQQASDFRETLGLSSDQVVPAIVPLIEKHGYTYREDDFGDDFVAFTEQVAPFKYLIGFNSRKQFSESFKRFTLSHELGHIVLHADILNKKRRLVSSPDFDAKDTIEREANEFAAHFLMPSTLFSSKCQAMDFSPTSIRALAEFFVVSEIATAIHFVEHTNLACSLVICDSQGNTKRENRSPKMQDLVKPTKYIAKTKVPENSLTGEWIKGRESEGKSIVPLKDWMPTLRKQMEAEEWVIKSPPNFFLALLTSRTPEITPVSISI